MPTKLIHGCRINKQAKSNKKQTRHAQRNKETNENQNRKSKKQNQTKQAPGRAELQKTFSAYMQKSCAGNVIPSPVKKTNRQATKKKNQLRENTQRTEEHKDRQTKEAKGEQSPQNTCIAKAKSTSTPCEKVQRPTKTTSRATTVLGPSIGNQNAKIKRGTT